MSLQAEVITSKQGVVQMFRQDYMFECGKGVVVMWPEQGATFIPATGKNKYGIDYLRSIMKEYNISSYKVEQAFFKLMLGSNYDRINVRL
jgi:hypothetical protein